MCNTLNPKLLIKETNSDNLKLLSTSCSKFLLIEGLNTESGDRRQSTHRHNRVIFNECRVQEAKEE